MIALNLHNPLRFFLTLYAVNRILRWCPRLFAPRVDTQVHKLEVFYSSDQILLCGTYVTLRKEDYASEPDLITQPLKGREISSTGQKGVRNTSSD